jgi:hypothetical protein
MALFLLLAVEATACPRCTYDRMLVEHWHLKYLLVSTIVPLVIVANRLDVVRFAFVLIPYVAFSYQFHSYLFWHTFPGDTFLAQVGWWTWGLNLVGVAMLYGISLIPFFRWKKEHALAVWQPIAYAAAMFVAQLLIR